METTEWLFNLRFVTALGCILVAGVFLAFSSFVMAALARLPAAQGVAAMQAINITVINPIFMLVFFGTAVLCLVLLGAALLRPQPGAMLVMLGVASYLLGTMLVTVACNVPLNDALAKLEPSSNEAAAFWASYLRNWTSWNHVRGVAALVAGVALLVSQRMGA